LLREQHQDLKLVLVGKREYHSKQLQKWIKKNTHTESVIFTGFVPDEELKWYYENARAYVFPSLSEGFGLPGLEAMVHGCPVVSSDATCLPEVNGDAAHYFDPLDIQDMATKIDEVISSEPLRKKLIAKGYENAKRFSWRRMATQTLEVYKKVLQ
jgi:glycosyltransferase involved in cell wall biosynthesis